MGIEQPTTADIIRRVYWSTGRCGSRLLRCLVEDVVADYRWRGITVAPERVEGIVARLVAIELLHRTARGDRVYHVLRGVSGQGLPVEDWITMYEFAGVEARRC